MKKMFLLIMVLVLALSLAACSSSEEATEEAANDGNEEVDVVTTASIVTEPDALVKGLSKDGTWIVATLNDIVVEEEVVVDGEFTHRDEIARKLGLYTQDEDRNVTARFTLTAPKMTVKSENFRIQNGTFKGDVYVAANGFHLKDATVEGNVIFASEDFKASFVNEGEVTGDISVE